MIKSRIVTAMCLFLSALGTSSFGMDSDMHQQNQRTQESQGLQQSHDMNQEREAMGSSIDAESSSITSEELERQQSVRPGESGKEGTMSRSGSPSTSPTGESASPNGGLGTQ